MNTRRITLLVAILLAIGTGFLTLNYVNAIKRTNVANNEPRTVLVAATDIPARTTITPQMFKSETRPASTLDSDAVADTNVANGALSLITIPAGAQITTSKIGRPQQVGLPVRLSPGKRAVSIQIDKVKGISGLLQPGDRVDVIAIPPKQGNNPPPAATILRGIRVLAIGNMLETSSATPSPDMLNSTTVTLEVTPRQADLLAMADENTTLRLSLRSPRESLASEPTEALRFPNNEAPAQQVATAPAPAPAPAQPVPAAAAPRVTLRTVPVQRGIMIIDGDSIGYGTTGARPAEQP